MMNPSILRPQSEYCFRKGAVGNHFFCIFSGEVDIILQEGARPIATLGPGQSFGEMALLNDAPRAASVRCRTAVICGQIHRSDFQRMISQQKAMADAKAYSTVNFTVPFNEMEVYVFVVCHADSTYEFWICPRRVLVVVVLRTISLYRNGNNHISCFPWITVDRVEVYYKNDPVFFRSVSSATWYSAWSSGASSRTAKSSRGAIW